MQDFSFERLLDWLASCPALAGVPLQMDYLPPQGGCGALFPQGVVQTEQRQNLLGDTVSRLRMELTLRLKLPYVPGDAALSARNAALLVQVQNWTAQQSAAGLAPTFGNIDPACEVLRAGAARMETADDEGSALYTMTLTAEYTVRWRETNREAGQKGPARTAAPAAGKERFTASAV